METVADRPVSELERLHSELERVHNYISELEVRLSPVIHHSPKAAEKAALGGNVPVSGHISDAVATATAAGTRVAELVGALAI